MNTEQLIRGLEAKFEQSRLVFWYDPEENFRETLTNITINDVTVLDVAEESVLQTKKRIELDESEQRFLLYFPYAEPEPERDWLLDIRLYSEQFFADHSSMLLNELGIPKMSLRGHVRKRQAFFANKQRMSGLKKWVTENEDELSLDRKMIAVLVKADSAALSDILLSLLSDYAESIDTDADESSLFNQLEKFGLDASLWVFLSDEFSYQVSEPSLPDFVLKLFCTELWSQIEGADRDWLLNNVLKTAAGRATALAFMASWRDSRSFSTDYNRIAELLAKQLEISQRCSHYQPNQIVECETFEAIEQVIIRGLVKDLVQGAKTVDRVQFDTLLSRRLVSHWCLSRPEYKAIYAAIRNAEILMDLRNRYVDGFHYDSLKAMYEAYVTELYRVDQAYRLFNEHVHSVLSKGADILRQLDEKIELLYSQWYLPELGLAWDRLIEADDKLNHWKVGGTAGQSQFYEQQVKNTLRKGDVKRVAVVISDALRYEVAQELFGEIERERRFKPQLSSQLGVLPSYTQLGMAALLPHKQLHYNGSTVMVDGASSSGLANRHAILEKHKGLACHYKDLLNWSNEEGREKIRDVEVLYIYHDAIDAIGDKAKTEDRTFAACRESIAEIKDVITRVINRLNISRVVITADHGFLFQQQAMQANDKTELNIQVDNPNDSSKRFVIAPDLPAMETCWRGELSKTSSCQDTLTFLLPKGNQRFHFKGGAKFVHGGLMPQEVCVPVLQVSALRGEKMRQKEKQPVGVVVATQPIKFVNNIDKVKFIQTEPVGEKFIPRQLDVFIVDDEGAEVSGRETMLFDSASKNMDERTREVRLKLIGSEFDRHAKYTLVLENIDTRTRYNQYAVTIDLAFQDDFF